MSRVRPHGYWPVIPMCLAYLLFSYSAAFAAEAGMSKPWYTVFTPILLLLGAVAFVIWRVPKPKPEHPGQFIHLETPGFRTRRAINWLAVGLAYALLYFGRYNLNPAIRELGGKDMVSAFNWIFSAGTIVYGFSFILNGPLTDKFGGRFSILLGVSGASVANLFIGATTWAFQQNLIGDGAFFRTLLVAYPINMYFQSFGAVAIVKCNAPWFHVRERGVFGAVFGILISLGIYFGFDWSDGILHTWNLSVPWVFFIPSACLMGILVVGAFLVRNRPSEAGFEDFKTGDATEDDPHNKPDPPKEVFLRMLKNPVIVTIGAIEFCTGFLRQAVMQQYPMFAKLVGFGGDFVMQNWGLLLCCAGIIGGVIAGTFSDVFFNSKRAMAALPMYAGLLIGVVAVPFALGSASVGWIAVFLSLCVIGVHGLLSGTATQDFGGTKNAGIVTGLIDGLVYLGTGTQSLLYALILPTGESAKNAGAWICWPIAMVPFAVAGVALCYRIRHAKPKKG